MNRSIALLAILATLSGCNPNGVEQNVPVGYTRSCPLAVQQENMNRITPDFRQCQVVPMEQAAIMQQQMIQQQQGIVPQPYGYSQPYSQQPVVVQQHDSTGALLVGGALGYLAGRSGSGSSGNSQTANRSTTVVNNNTTVVHSPSAVNQSVTPAPSVQQKPAAPAFQPTAARNSTTVTPMRSSGINLSKSTSSSSFSSKRK